MKKKSTSRIETEQMPSVSPRRSAPSRSPQETVEEAVARVRAMPSFLEEIGPEAIAQFQREMADHPEVMGRLPPVKPRKHKR